MKSTPMKSNVFGRVLTVLALPVMCGLLVACSGSSEQANAPTAAASAPAGKPAAVSKPAQPSMVKAVATGSAGQRIDVQFELAARPELGKPIDLTLRLQGLADATDLHVAVKADPRLEILAGEQASFPSLNTGEMHAHSVSLRGAATGIFVVDVQLVAMIGGSSQTLNYAIPVAIVEPQPAVPQATATAKTASGS